MKEIDTHEGDNLSADQVSSEPAFSSSVDQTVVKTKDQKDRLQRLLGYVERIDPRECLGHSLLCVKFFLSNPTIAKRCTELEIDTFAFEEQAIVELHKLILQRLAEEPTITKKTMFPYIETCAWTYITGTLRVEKKEKEAESR